MARKRRNKKGTPVSTSFTEEMIFNPPRGMEEYRCFRIEYGGHAEECLIEGRIWVPRWIDADVIEDLLNKKEHEERSKK